MFDFDALNVFGIMYHRLNKVNEIKETHEQFFYSYSLLKRDLIIIVIATKANPAMINKINEALKMSIPPDPQRDLFCTLVSQMGKTVGRRQSKTGRRRVYPNRMRQLTQSFLPYA